MATTEEDNWITVGPIGEGRPNPAPKTETETKTNTETETKPKTEPGANTEPKAEAEVESDPVPKTSVEDQKQMYIREWLGEIAGITYKEDIDWFVENLGFQQQQSVQAPTQVSYASTAASPAAPADRRAAVRYATAAFPMRKTVHCRQWMNGNSCSYGDRCDFAHGLDEICLPYHPPPQNAASNYPKTQFVDKL